MEEIKSVRVRRRILEELLYQFDIKVILYDNDNKKSAIGLNIDGMSVWGKIDYRKTGRYSNYTNDELIKDFIDINSRREKITYDIIQDPWLEKPPKERSFGFDPYCLNNGAKILIKWFDGNLSVGGKSWSDLDGKELDIQKGQTQSTKGFITKTAEVLSPGSYEGENKFLKLTSMGLESKSDIQLKEFSGTVDDKDIINQVISFWKTRVPNYDDLGLCEPDNEFCELIDFINPVDELEQNELEEDNKLVSEDPIFDDKIKLSFEMNSNLKIKPREDFNFKLFIGEPPQDPNLEGFDFGDDQQDLSLLGDDFTEDAFAGKEESELEIQEYPDEKTRIDTENHAIIINQKPYIPGKYKLDLIPGVFFDNKKQGIQCCQIDGRPINVNIADAVLDMKEAAKRDGVNLIVTSGFRPGFNPSISATSENGVKVTAQSQEELYQQNCVGKPKCSPATAPAGRSKHGNGIAVDFNTGSRTGRIRSKLNNEVYSWLVKNSWRFGFVRTVSSEEWHYEYWSQDSKRGPYAKLTGSDNNLFYSDLNLNNIQVT